MKKAFIATEKQVKELLILAHVPLFMMENMKVGGQVYLAAEDATIKMIDNKYIVIMED